MSKRNLLIIVAAVMVICSFALWYLSSIQKKPLPKEPSDLTNDNENPTEKPTPSPSATLTPQDNTTYISVIDPTNRSEHLNAFKTFTENALSDQNPKQTLEKETSLNWSKIVDTKKSPVPLNKFSPSVGMYVHKDIDNLLDQNNYDLFSCTDKNKKKQFGILLNARLFDGYPNLYNDMVNFMRSWEGSLFDNVKSVIFPTVKFDDSDLANQNLQFKDGVARYAEITFPDGSKGSINYDIVADSIIISSSIDCIKEAKALIEPLDP